MSKYGNRKVADSGLTFDSQAEYARWCELQLLCRAGEITALEVHPRFTLQESFRRGGKTVRAITYVADFAYTESGCRVVEDVKGGRATQTAVFKLKAKLFSYRYRDIELRIVER